MKAEEHEPRVRVAGIIIEDEKILLISHKKNDSVYWLLPGGGVDYGESLEEALVREFSEELNIDIRVEGLALLCDSIDPEGNRHIINICFHCTYLNGEYTVGNDERLNNYGFFRPGELKGLQIYPPVNDKLAEIFTGNAGIEYLGKLWQKA